MVYNISIQNFRCDVIFFQIHNLYSCTLLSSISVECSFLTVSEEILCFFSVHDFKTYMTGCLTILNLSFCHFSVMELGMPELWIFFLNRLLFFDMHWLFFPVTWRSFSVPLLSLNYGFETNMHFNFSGLSCSMEGVLFLLMKWDWERLYR